MIDALLTVATPVAAGHPLMVATPVVDVHLPMAETRVANLF
jgi:hypothetical protein